MLGGLMIAQPNFFGPHSPSFLWNIEGTVYCWVSDPTLIHQLSPLLLNRLDELEVVQDL